MHKERTNAGGLRERVEQRVRSGLGLIPAEQRTPLAPATTGNDTVLVFYGEVGLIINQLGVDAEYVASDRVCLFRRIVADTQGVTGEFNELAKSWDIRSLSSTQFHC